MSIETTRAPEGVKPAAAAAHRGTAATSRNGAVGAPGAAGAGGGFAGLLSLLSAADAQSAALEADLPVADTTLTLPVAAENQEQNQPLAIDAQGLIAMNSVTGALPTVSSGLPPTSTASTVSTAPTTPPEASALLAAANVPMALVPVVATSETPAGSSNAPGTATTDPASPVAAAVEGANPLGQRALAPSNATAQAQFEPKELAAKPGNTSVLAASDSRSAEPATVNTDVATLLDHRRASQSHAAAQTQFELRDARLQPASQQALAGLDASRAAPVLLPTDVLAGSTDRRDGRPGTGLTRTGLEGALGGTVADRLGINPTYEVAAASAVVPEGQVAETVSYWASHGVQSAELTLDGLGDEPVEVRISVEGDQAQIDFRSNQPEVRQALEAASAQLKALLSGEGLQLSGMSVGTSGRGANQSEGGQPKSSPRQAKLVSLEPVRASSARAANPAVGQALDLYV